MSAHEGYSCDFCQTEDFSGFRYCCEIYKERLNETEYLSILLDYCLQRFINDTTYYQHINTIHFKERFADALNWTNGFIAKLSGSRLTGLVEQYFVESNDDQLLIIGGDTEIIFEPQDTFVLDIDTGSLSQIGFVERTSNPGFYYIKYNPHTKYHSTLQNLDIFEKRKHKKYISSKKIIDLLHNEFQKNGERGPCIVELNGPAVSTILNDGTTLQDFIFSLPMLKIPCHIRDQWLNRSKQWPSIDVAETVCNSICHLVPKQWNTINEDEEDTLAWRLSLNFAEVLLTNSWNQKQKNCYLLLKSFVQEVAPDILSSHQIKTFMFIYMETNNHWIQQTDNQAEIFLHLIQSLSLVLKSKVLPNYFIPNINMLRLIPEKHCLYLIEILDRVYIKPIDTIKRMTRNFKNFSRWSQIKVPLIDDYSKIQVYTWYLRSLLCLALKERDHLQLQRLKYIVELSNLLFFDNISNVEEFIFTWINIIITPSLRKKLPNCFDQNHLACNNKNPIWLTYNLWEPIVFVFNIMDIYFDDDNKNKTEEEEEDNCTTDDFIILPFLKFNGVPTNKNDYNFIPISKMQIQTILEILITMLCGPLLDLSSCYNLQYFIGRFHAIGFKNELLSNAFYEAALEKSIVIFSLKYDLYALEINDPVCVNFSKEQQLLIKNRHDVRYEQMKSLFDGALQLSSTETWKIKVHMGYTYYFLFGYYHEAIDLMKSTIEDYNTNTHKTNQCTLSVIVFTRISKKCPILTYLCKKLGKTDLVIPTIVLAYYTLFQSYRMTDQWDNGQEYIEQFKDLCILLETNFRGEDYDESVVKLLLATSFLCLASMDEALELTFQFLKNKNKLSDELMSLCGIQYLLPGIYAQHFLDHDVILEIPYALSECGGENETVHVRAQLINKLPPTFIIRHGYDCYKMRSWLINEITILNELKKWMSRLPVAIVFKD